MTITVPTDISGLLSWCDASQLTGLADNDPVASFTDQSGNSRHILQAASGSQPLYKTGIQNGLPALRFDGSDDGMFLALTGDATLTNIVVMKKRSGVDFTVRTYYGIRDDNAGGHHFGSDENISFGFLYYPNPSFGATDIGGDPTAAQITAQRYNSTSSMEYFFEGSRKGSLDPQDDYPAFDTFYLGTGPYGSECADIDVFEVLIYDRALTDKEMYDLMSYLGNKWGVAGHAPNLIANRGTQGNIVSATTATVTITNPTLIDVGSKLLLYMAIDNSGTAGAARTVSIVDSKGHTWTQIMAQNRTPGAAANDGTTLYLYETTVTTAFVAANTVVVTFSGAVIAKALILEEWARLGTVAVSALYAVGASTAPSRTAVPTAANQVVIGALATEGVLADTYTADADVTSGWWQPVDRIASGGTTTSGQTIATQYKRVTASGTQTYNPTITNRDFAIGTVVYNPTAYPIFSTTPKVRVSGSFVDKPLKVKIGGVWVTKQMKVKVSGTFVNV